MTDQPAEPQQPGTEGPPPEAPEAPEAPPQPAEEKAFDGAARPISLPEGLRDQEEPTDSEGTDATEESDGGATLAYRSEFYGSGPSFGIGGDAKIGMAAGRDVHIHRYGGREERVFRQKVRPKDLAEAEAQYVDTGTEAELRRAFERTPLVFVRAWPGGGARTTAIAVLDELTGRERGKSHLRRLSPATPSALAEAVEERVGLLVDTVGTGWTAGLRQTGTDDLENRLRGRRSFMIVLVDAGASLPVGGAVTHVPPETEQVFQRHLAFLRARGPDGETPSRNRVDATVRDELPDLIKEIEAGPQEAQEWYDTLRSPGTPPREGVIFAQEWWNWRRLRAEAGAEDDEPPFPRHNLDEQARNLLRRKNGADNSPVRQAYVIAAAVLDDVPMSDIPYRAVRLAERFTKIESPGAEVRREVFGEPFRSWLEQLSAGLPKGSSTDPVWQRQRRLSRAVVEVAWSDYDVVREPLRKWLVELCEQNEVRQRIRAVHALTLVADQDYPQVKKVLQTWWNSARNRDHECAAWLLEAMIRYGTPEVGRKAERELNNLSRSQRKSQRAVALRAYGTRITTEERLDRALEAVHESIGMLRGRFSLLIAQCLRDLYDLGHREPVLRSLVGLVTKLPLLSVREQAARTIVLIARLPAGGRGHDLLRFLHVLPGGDGDDRLAIADVAELWWYACDWPSTRKNAWSRLGRWHAECVAHPELMPTFEALLDAMALIDRPDWRKDDRPMPERIDLYREFWKKKAQEKEQ